MKTNTSVSKRLQLMVRLIYLKNSLRTDLGSLVTIHNGLGEKIKEYEKFFKPFFPKEN
jgi:hypothetical protein